MGAYYSGIIDWRYTKRPVTCGYECDYPTMSATPTVIMLTIR